MTGELLGYVSGDESGREMDHPPCANTKMKRKEDIPVSSAFKGRGLS